MEKRRTVKRKAPSLPGFISNEETQNYLNGILYLVESSKSARSEALAFDPSKPRKEPPKLAKELRKLKSDNKAIEEQNTLLRKEVRALELPLDRPGKWPRKLKKSVPQSETVRVLKEFNKQAHQAIQKLTKEIESDTYDYGLGSG